MAHWAQIEDDRVVNIIEAEEDVLGLLPGTYIEITPEFVVHIGYIYVSEIWVASPEEAENVIKAELRASDALFDPRWLEDLRLGLPSSAREQAWLEKRTFLRQQLATLT